mmetsp:Transcript_18996/g.37636  ORF Transcript_18996/g.37636 Transcript_18996/m.37636 type:complete len:200 (+) Transcript_18996:791-1390(+)
MADTGPPEGAEEGGGERKSGGSDEEDEHRNRKGGGAEEVDDDDDADEGDDDDSDGGAPTEEELNEAKAVKKLRSKVRTRVANLRDAQQETPLIWACSFEVDGGASQDGARALERLPLAKLLVNSGADANAQNGSGQTALHAAARAGALVLVEYLIYEANASPAIRDSLGQPALTYAKLYSKDKNTIDLLRRTTPNDNEY